jgi:hypothetical protein
MADSVKVEYDKQDLRIILKSFKAMDDEATQQAKKVGYELAQYLTDKIKQAANSTPPKGDNKIADNVKVSKSSKIGEFGFGYSSQRVFSGGASTLDLVYGLEFGSYRYSQFPKRSAKLGRGSEGYFIYPTLRKYQPEIIKKWETAFEEIIKRFT